MEWINSVLFEHSAIQAVVVMALIIFSGLALGRIRVAGISLGVTFVFFMGIFAGYLGLSIDHQMLNYAESFGLVLFPDIQMQIPNDVAVSFHSTNHCRHN